MIFFASLIFLTNLSTWSRTDLVFLGVLLKSYACCLALTNFLPVVRPAPRLYWQWMFARRCCPRRACYTLRKSRRFITWQIYCLPCLSLPSRNLSEWGNSTSSGSRPLFFLKMKKKAATFDISDDTADVCCQLNIDANILCNQTSFLAPTHPQLLNLCKRCFKLKGQACRQLRENVRCKTFFDSREFTIQQSNLCHLWASGN